MPDTPDLCEAAQDAVAGLIHVVDPGSMVTRFVLLAEIVDPEGERAVWSATPPGQKVWDSLGLIDYARAQEYAATAAESDDE